MSVLLASTALDLDEELHLLGFDDEEDLDDDDWDDDEDDWDDDDWDEDDEDWDEDEEWDEEEGWDDDDV